jgi:hypothetical protein
MSEKNYGGMMDGVMDKILQMMGFSKDHVDKIKFILDTIEVTEDEITVSINDRVKLIIKK